MVKAKNCPFCDSEKIELIDGRHGYFCRCNNCGCRLHGQTDDEKHAIQEWNKVNSLYRRISLNEKVRGCPFCGKAPILYVLSDRTTLNFVCKCDAFECSHAWIREIVSFNKENIKNQDAYFKKLLVRWNKRHYRGNKKIYLPTVSYIKD